MRRAPVFVSLVAMAWAMPALAQGTPAADAAADSGIADIVVTAQRQSQRLQDVPIAVTAFSADTIEKQQIVNPLSLQQSLPNVTFTKTNFTSSSFTIRGIGDLCVGATCDSATAIHVNDMPLLGSRLFETEYLDLERVEVLRGPQGTLFGRNATSGVVNFITAKPNLSKFIASGELEYGNFNSKKAKGMINVPIGETLGIRVAGIYLKRDGYTNNLYTGNRIDGRDLYSVRGTLSWQPDADTRVDLIGYYFREKDNRSRIQKQLCHRDPTGILGCAPDKLAFETVNQNAALASILPSREFLSIAVSPALAPFALGSVYGTDQFAGVVNPADVRTVNIDFEPTYYAEEEQYTAKIFHDFGNVAVNFTGGYMRTVVDSRADVNLAVENSLAGNAGLNTLNAIGRVGLPGATFNNVRQYVIPNGPATICQSLPDPNGVGVYGGNGVCAPTSLDTDRSTSVIKQYSAEAHIDSSFDGPFNFLLGGIYFKSDQTDVDYYLSQFGLDYGAGLVGAAQSGGASFSATSFFRSNTPSFKLTSYGVFGETYFTPTDRLKVTLGLRYNHDDKSVIARSTVLNVLVPFGATTAVPQLNAGTVDFDPSTPGIQTFATASVAFTRLTGRAVIDYKITPNNLVYASYSRGYKSGGINPPLSPTFVVPTTFDPENVDAFEIGSKNTFLDGTLRLNLTGFYYKYQNLQLSRIVARTSVNDNVNADIYGVEAEAIVRPVPALTFNATFSYLNSRVTNDKFLSNARDPSAGRSDVVIVKDVTNASNCAVVPTTAGNAAGANAFVNTINGAVGLQPTTPIPGTNTTGAFGVCSALTAQAAAIGAAFGGISVVSTAIPVNVRDNQLPNAPEFKASVGVQYAFDLGGGYSLVPRADLNFTGPTWGTIFNKNPIDRIQGYEVINAQIQFNAPDDRFFVRAFVQNLTDNSATTGMYASDQSVGLYTNIFTLEPRRYGIAAGFKF